MQKITNEKLSEILGYNKYTIRTWLGNYRFSKFRLERDYKYSEEFVQVLIDFLELKGKYRAAENLRQYVRNFNEPV